MKQRYHLIIGVIAVLGILLVIGCVQESEQIDKSISTKSTSSPITTKLDISNVPKLNEQVILTLTINSAFDAQDSEASIEIPEGAIKLNGDLSWKGDLKENVPVQISTEIKFIQEGNWDIKGSAKHIIDESNVWGDVDYVYLCIKEDFGKIGFCDISASEKTKQVVEEHPVCPGGYEWESCRNECVPLEHPTCPDNYKWEPCQQECVLKYDGEHPVCPGNFTWDEISQSCKRKEGTEIDD